MTREKTGTHGKAPVQHFPGRINAFPGGIGHTVSGELNYLVRHMMEKGRDAIQQTSGDWPRATLAGESVSAEVIFTPQAQNPQAVIPDEQVEQYRQRMWGLLQSLDDLTADVWDALVCQWVAGAPSLEAKVWVSVDEILPRPFLPSFWRPAGRVYCRAANSRHRSPVTHHCDAIAGVFHDHYGRAGRWPGQPSLASC